MRNALLVVVLAPLIAAARQDAGPPTPPRRVLVRLARDAELPRIEGVVFGGRVGDVVSADVAPGAEARLSAAAPVRAVESDPRVFPHNDIGQASTIGFRGDISIAAEVDSYGFSAVAGQTVRIRVHAEAALDPFVATDNGGAVSDDNSGPGSDADLSITWISAGTKTIDVSGAAATTGAYLLTITSSTPILPGDLSGGDIGAGSAHLAGTRAREARGIEGLDGSGVVIGLVDSGIDFTHADFRTAATATRVQAIWDQTLTPVPGEQSPDVGGDGDGSNDYGVEYGEAQINAELDGTTTGFVRHTDATGHGTHVAGIAAGDGSAGGSGYVGAAPGARLIVVKHAGTASRVIDGMHYVIRKAAELGTYAVVINLSLGTHDGPHDGTSAFDQAIEGAVARGRFVVCSMGNEGALRLHAKHAFGPAYAFTFTPSTAATYGSGTTHLLDFWATHGDGYSVIVSDGTDSISALNGSAPAFGPAGPKYIKVENRTDSPANEATHIRISINNDVLAPWTLTFTRTSFGGTGLVDGWVASETGTFASTDIAVNADGSVPGTVSEPATAVSAVAVGAYRTKFAWESGVGRTLKPDGIGASVSGNAADYSSRGPTRDGREKPDIAAPGGWVASARASTWSTPTGDEDVDAVHAHLEGTSMAAPHVAGVLALALQKNNLYEVSGIKALLAQTAISDVFVSPGNTWGAGKADAVGLLAAIPVRVDVTISAGVCFTGASGTAPAAAALLAGFLLIARRRCP